jgi:hypothetical protein
MSNMMTIAPVNSVAMIPIDDVERMAHAIAKSGLFGVKTPEQALALMLVAQSEGLHPATAARDYHIISGRPSMKADAMVARFQAAGGIIKWLENSDTRCSGEFSHPASPTPVMIDWDLNRAKKAQLLSNAMWTKYPRSMLRARVVSEGIRTVYPGVLCGMYTPEEVESFTPEPTARIERDITPPVPEPLPELPRITASQHKALEARIHELQLDRERVKSWVFRASRETVEHFPDMPPALYKKLWEKLPEMAAAYEAERAAVVPIPTWEGAVNDGDTYNPPVAEPTEQELA